MILVTGANGTNGREVVSLLAAAGVPVRAMVRHQSVIPQEASPAIEFVTADFDDSASIRQMLDGIDRAFLVTNSTERAETQQLQFVETARGAGVSHIVYLSQLGAALDSPVRFLRYHAVVENAIASSGMTFTHLRPNLYMQGFFAFRSAIAADGRFFAPAGDARVSIVDVRDIAAVAAKALTEDGYGDKIFDVTGPDALTHAEMAAELSAVVGKPVVYIDVPDGTMRAALLDFGLPEWQVDGLIEDYAHYRRDEASAVSTAVADVTGRAPRSFAAFAREYATLFSS